MTSRCEATEDLSELLDAEAPEDDSIDDSRLALTAVDPVVVADVPGLADVAVSQMGRPAGAVLLPVARLTFAHPEHSSSARQTPCTDRRAGKALEALSEVLRDQERFHGPAHPHTLATRYDRLLVARHTQSPLETAAQPSALREDGRRTLATRILCPQTITTALEAS
jgi:hypothetical protein